MVLYRVVIKFGDLSTEGNRSVPQYRGEFSWVSSTEPQYCACTDVAKFNYHPVYIYSIVLLIKFETIHYLQIRRIYWLGTSELILQTFNFLALLKGMSLNQMLSFHKNTFSTRRIEYWNQACNSINSSMTLSLFNHRIQTDRVRIGLQLNKYILIFKCNIRF